MGKTTIEWTDRSVNPVRARMKDGSNRIAGHYCEKISAGCTNCYASNMQKRFGMPAFGSGQLRDDVEIFLDESKLNEVRRRKIPTKWFWGDMTDLFGEWMKLEWLQAIFETIDATPWHVHQLLTKRPENIRGMWGGWCDNPDRFQRPDVAVGQPAYRQNVWIGTSVANQADADRNIPKLFTGRDLAPVLFVSYEPAIGPVDFSKTPDGFFFNHMLRDGIEYGSPWTNAPLIDWIICGGESGPKARPCNVDWIRSAVEQCKVAEVACFVKQLGSNATGDTRCSRCGRSGMGGEWSALQCPEGEVRCPNCPGTIRDKYNTAHPKGGDISEFPEDLRVREFPKVLQATR